MSSQNLMNLPSSINFSSLAEPLSQASIDQFDVPGTTNQSISSQISLAPVPPVLSKFNKHSRKQILFFSTVNPVKKSHKTKLSKSNAQQNTLQNTQQNEQEIQMRAISESDFMQMIIKNLQRLDISERSSTNLPSQNSTVVIQSFSVFSTAACGSSTKVSVNLVSGLIYFDLVEDELPASMNDKMIFLMRDTPMLYS